jgi:hypothetical protein
MGLLESVTVRNFRCFRAEVTIPLAQATYLVGPNNSGKTSLLTALQCFLDSTAFTPALLNKTEQARRREGSNRADITVVLDLTSLPPGKRRKRLIERYGPKLDVQKSFSWREVSGTTVVEYKVQDVTGTFENVDEDVQAVINAISVSYIHPQEGAALLQKAQDKFKQRLFHNWGRHASVAERLKQAQSEWEKLRKTANNYLSSALTDRLRQIWPDSETKVDLPERIEDIVAISDITFRSSPALPAITLPSHGTGAQSAILYQTHYVLDSDRTLHRGMYFPVWLLEEPESFLHADIALQLASLLSSDEWLGQIQMVISTHSPIVLAASRQNADITRWVAFEDHAVLMTYPVSDVDERHVQAVGRMMGDANFDVYFTAAASGPLIFVEDSRPLTQNSFAELGIPLTGTLDGVDHLKKYLAVLPHLQPLINERAYFIIDSDKGKQSLTATITNARLDADIDGWRKYETSDGVFLVLLPDGSAVEDLFEEWDDELKRAIGDLFDHTFALNKSVPLDLSRVVSALRSKRPQDEAAAKGILRSHQDVKDRFWASVEQRGYAIAPSHAAALRQLLDLE